jgi:hypothetical protein
MRLVRFWVALPLALVACELARPEGAYIEREAMVPDAGLTDTPRVDSGMGVAPPPVPGGIQSGTQGGGVPGAMPGGMPDTTQGGMPGTTPGGTAGGMMGGVDDAGPPVLTPEQQALKSLEGRYFMRMDMLSTASVRASIVTLNTINRVSHLIATQLYVENGQLKGSERLCYQTFEHRCMSGCTALTTRMATGMTDWFVKTDYTPRAYVLSNGMLSAMSNSMALGFDAMTDPRLPTIQDARVWDSGPANAREGLLLGLQLSALRNVTCDVYTTQIFVSKFGPGRLGGNATAPALEGVQFKLDTTGSDGAQLGQSNTDCRDEGSNPPASEGEQLVRFARVAAGEFGGEEGTAFWSCPPQSEWDTRLSPPAL